MKRQLINFGKKATPHAVRILFRRLNWKRQYLQQNLFRNPAEPVFCPIAEKEFKSFIKDGNELYSPTNGARRRQRLVWLYLKNELGLLHKKAKVLHVAPELAFSEILSRQKNLTYVPGDKMVDGYSNQAGVLNIDLTDLSFDDNSFDYILCNHVLEHIPDDARAMREMYRVLKAGGEAIITVPIDESLDATYENPAVTTPDEREKHFGQWDHVRLYGTDIKKRLEKAGFTVELNRYGKKFSETEFNRYGLNNNLIVVARKGAGNGSNSGSNMKVV